MCSLFSISQDSGAPLFFFKKNVQKQPRSLKEGEELNKFKQKETIYAYFGKITNN